MEDTGVAGRLPRLLTVGHGTASQDEFGELLAGAGVQALVDVQHLMPGGRLAPHQRTSGVRVTGNGLVYDQV